MRLKEFLSESQLNLSSKDRIVNTSKPFLDMGRNYTQPKEAWRNTKPLGLWYGFGDSWIQWVKREMPQWERRFNIKIEIDESKILTIQSHSDLVDFSIKYKREDPELDRLYEYSINSIHWDKVKLDYWGIEINPHQEESRYFEWYRGWDVASGCVWNTKAITKWELLNDGFK